MYPEEESSLGRFISRRRKIMGLTQDKLAEKIGVSKSAIAKWETDGGVPDRDNLKRLSGIMNTSVDELHRMIGGEAEEVTALSVNITKDIISILEVHGYKVTFPTKTRMEEKRMGVFEIEGRARKMVECDIANISISFRAAGINSAEILKKVVDECDRFLKEAYKAGLKPEAIHFDEDSVESRTYEDNREVRATRTIRIRMPFEMKYINGIQSILSKGGYRYLLSVSGENSKRDETHIELAKQAVRNSKEEAEQLAEVLGVKVQGIESVCKETRRGYNCGAGDILGLLDDFEEERPSDNIGAKLIEESVELKVKWILE